MIENEYTYTNGKYSNGSEPQPTKRNVNERYTIYTAKYGEISAEKLAELNQREKEQAQPKQYTIPAPELKKTCPFADGIHTECKQEQCAFYLKGCILSADRAARDTEGLTCPFKKYKCHNMCALYKNGCTFTAIKRESEA